MSAGSRVPRLPCTHGSALSGRTGPAASVGAGLGEYFTLRLH